MKLIIEDKNNHFQTIHGDIIPKVYKAFHEIIRFHVMFTFFLIEINFFFFLRDKRLIEIKYFTLRLFQEYF